MDSRNNNIVNELDFADAANRIEHRATPSLGVLLAQCGGQLNLNEVQEIAKLSIISEVINDAGVAELADAQDLGSCGRKVVEVQVLSSALFFHSYLSSLQSFSHCPTS